MLYNDLEYRGLINQVTDEGLKEILEKEKISLYCGFDPTAKSLHVGSLLPIVTLMRFEKENHNVMALVGGATGLIGDPSGRSMERELNDEETVNNFSNGIKNQLSRFLDFEKKSELINNYDWTSEITLIEFLRDIGKNFGINYLLGKDSISSRLETGLSFTEFTYTILQANDFKYLYETKDCKLQIGGSDQWGNITSGLEYIRKTQGENAKAYGLTIPLVTKADGTKFGKTAGGAIWLDSDLTSPYEFYQFWVNTPDSDVIKYIKYFTFLSKEEIQLLEEKVKTEPHIREAQKTLAKEVTTLVHGNEAYEDAIRVSDILFKGNVNELTSKEIELYFNSVKSIEINNKEGLLNALVNVGAANSNREAREFINNNAISLNGEKVNDIAKELTKIDAIDSKYIVVRKGKKNYFLIKFI